MYRLTVVAGPNRGSSYPLHEGETTLGRLSENTIALNSSKVSKRHCMLVVGAGEVICKDQGSSNGTFVNGVLTKTPRQIQPGDQISVGDFVFELSVVMQGFHRDPLALPGALVGAANLPMAGGASGAPGSVSSGMTGFSSVAAAAPQEVVPQDFKSRMLWIFERRIMPHLYQLLLKYEWRTLLFGSYVFFSLIALFFAVAPLIQSNEVLMVRELERRAKFMAQQIVEVNVPHIRSRSEASTEIPDSIEKGFGVRQAFLVDLDNRILAPASKLNQYITVGPAAIAAVKAKQVFLETGRMRTFSIPVGSHTVVAVEPMLLYSEREGKNIPVAMGVVALDASVVTQGFGDVAIIFAEAFIWLVFFGMLLALVVYRLTLKPLEIINDEVDRSLKGDEFEQMSRDCRFEELGQLQDVLDSLLQRVSTGGSSDRLDDPGTSSISIGDECLPAFRVLGEELSSGMAFCDGERRVLFVNTAFEDLTGIRGDNAFMQPLVDQARDQALASFIADLFDRCGFASDGISEEFEFSGVPFRVQAIPIGVAGNAPRGFLLLTVRSEHG